MDEDEYFMKKLQELINRIQDISGDIKNMIGLIDKEHDRIHKPKSLHQILWEKKHGVEILKFKTLHDKFLLISIRILELKQTITNAFYSILRNHVVLPLMISKVADHNLMRITNGRLAAFSPEIVPHYLRTKTIPDVETFVHEIEEKSIITTSKHEQISEFRTIVHSALEMLAGFNHYRKQENDANNKTYSPRDTNLLLNFLNNGPDTIIIEPTNVPSIVTVEPRKRLLFKTNIKRAARRK